MSSGQDVVDKELNKLADCSEIEILVIGDRVLYIGCGKKIVVDVKHTKVISSEG